MLEKTESHAGPIPALEPEEPLAEVKVCDRCGSRFSGDARFCPFDGEPLGTAADGLPTDPLLGALIDGRYEVEAVLGEGGMGTVYRVRHKVLERPFALKVLRSDLSRDSDLGERFLREAKAAASISHRSIVQITDFGALPSGQPFFVMELLTGESLSTILRRGGPLPAARAVRIIAQMISALGAAHAAFVIHRDFKPDNVLVGTADGVDTVKILDFGLAKVAGQSRLTKAGVVFGTPHYMSPEQASGGAVDERTDLYALGVVMYEMFTGHVPFEADTYMGVLTKHLYVAPTPPSVHLGGMQELGALESVVLRCLEKRPERRYANMAELGVELARIARFADDGVFSVEPANATCSRPPRLADELELPSDTELELARAGIPGRRLSAPAVAALLALTVVCALTVGVVIVRARSRPGPVSAEPARSTPASSLAASGSGEPAPRPSSSETAAAPAVRVEPISATVASVREPANSATNGVPHVGKRAKALPASGLPNNSIKQGKKDSNGIVDPWKR